MSGPLDFSGGPPDATDFGFLDGHEELETVVMPKTAAHARKAARRELVRALQMEAVTEILPRLPDPGVSVHIIANGRYDFWTFIPHVLRLLGGPVAFYGSTWTMNRGNALELLSLYDAGALTCVNLLTGLYFKRRESAVYATLAEGLQDRGQRFLALENHAKVALLDAGYAHIVIEGSANFTANPRVEQYVVTNDSDLLAFHRAWMDDVLTRGSDGAS